MPTFDFRCDKCEKVFEFNTNKSVPVSMRPPEDGKCPECKEGTLEMQFSPQGQSIDFVGSGFYINDYGKHNWKQGKTPEEITQILADGKDPY